MGRGYLFAHKNDNSIIFKSKSSVKLQVHKLELKYSHDLSYYIRNAEFLENSIRSVTDLCNKEYNPMYSNCPRFLETIKHNRNIDKNNIEMLKNINKQKKSDINVSEDLRLLPMECITKPCTNRMSRKKNEN